MAVLLLGGLFSAPADAAQPYITQTANVRSCINLANGYCAPFAQFGGSTAVVMVCWQDGSWATGAYSSNRWFMVRRVSDGYEGWVHSSLVGAQAWSPWCGDVLRVRAGLKAILRLGQVYATTADASRFTDWAPGPYGEWSGDCIKLVNTSYFRAGRSLVAGNAWPVFNYYRQNGSVSAASGLPRYGSIVGWEIVMPAGHAAVAIGGNRVATTLGLDGNRYANAVRTTSSFGNYRGWAVPR